jgi:beta-glucanase (GH16 family)
MATYNINGNIISPDDYLLGLEGLLTDRLLIWHDEFDAPQIDTEKWSNVYGNYRNYNWNSKDMMRNISSGKGMSLWTAKDHPNEVSDYSGAYITTDNKFEFRYGRIEAKMRFTNASPHHVTFWTLGACEETINTGEKSMYDNTKGVKFPSCGEIDIAEYNNGTVGARTHWATNGFDTETTAAQGGNINSLTSTPSEWHIYACEWTADTISFYVDGVQKGTWDTSNATVNGWNPFKIPHFLIFNCISSLGGTINWDIAKTDVAWVRVYAPLGVTEYITETAITIPTTLSIAVGERSYLTPTFTPENPSDMTIRWESYNENVAICYGGMVTGIGAGSTMVKATTRHGCVAFCKVTVS